MPAKKKATVKVSRSTKVKQAKKKVTTKATSNQLKVLPKIASGKGIRIQKVITARRALSKAQILSLVCEQVGISRKEADAVLEVLVNVIHAHVRRGSCGEFKLPGLFKIMVVQKPARKSYKGRHPFTGEEMVFKAKPAYKTAKVRILKRLKDMVS